MDIWVLFSWKTKLKQRAWTVAECPYCQGLEPTRVEEKVWTFSVYLIPLIQANKGWIARCDFCERPIKAGAPAQSVALEDWSPDQGLAPLFRQLGYTGRVVVRRGTVDERLRSMLSAAEDAAGLNRMDVTWGMSTGAIFGAILGGLLGYVAFQLRLGGLDAFASSFLGVLAGAVIGLAGGGLTQWLIWRVPTATKLIEAACSHYKVDLNRLAELSRERSHCVQQAVLEVRDGLALRDG